jgi:anti-anti-sigma factor
MESVVATLAGELDLATRPELDIALDKAIGEDVPTVVLDLADVTFVDASSLRSFGEAAQRLRAEGRTLVLRNPSRLTRRLLAITDIDSVAIVEDP